MSDCSNTIEMIRWDSDSIDVEFTNEDWTPFDLTWYTIFFTARLPDTVDDANDDSAKIKKDILDTDLPDPTNWQVSVLLDSTDTDTVARYVWDLSLVNWTKVVSSMQWELVIIQDITKRTAVV